MVMPFEESKVFEAGRKKDTNKVVDFAFLANEDRSAVMMFDVYRRWKVHAATEFGKGLVRSRSTFPRGRRRSKGEREGGGGEKGCVP